MDGISISVECPIQLTRSVGDSFQHLFSVTLYVLAM